MSTPAYERKQRARKHAKLQSEVVKAAMARYYTELGATTNSDPHYRERPFAQACAALDKFETED